MIDIKISIGETFTESELKKYGSIDYRIAQMPKVGDRIFLSAQRLERATNAMRNRLKNGYNFVNLVAYTDDGEPVIMLGRDPELKTIEIHYQDQIIETYAYQIPRLGERVELQSFTMLSGDKPAYVSAVDYDVMNNRVIIRLHSEAYTQRVELDKMVDVNIAKADSDIDVNVANRVDVHVSNKDALNVNILKSQVALPVQFSGQGALDVNVKSCSTVMNVNVTNPKLSVATSSNGAAMDVNIKGISGKLQTSLPVEIRYIGGQLNALPVQIEGVTRHASALPVTISGVDNYVTVPVRMDRGY